MVRASLAVCLLLGSAPNCTDLYSLATHGFTTPTVEAGSGSSAVVPGGLLVSVHFTATNPNPYPISLSGVDYQVALQGEQVFTGTQDGLEVAENAQGALDLTGVIAYGSGAYRSLQPGQSASYAITGVAHVNSPAGVPVDVEFEADGTFIVPGNLPTH